MPLFNLSLDDFSPHPRAGLNFESIKWCDKLIEKYPKLKVNLFVPAAYCRLGENPCYLTKNLEWVKKANELSDNYRINFHGFYHRRVNPRRGNSNNDEWQFLNEGEARNLAVKMLNEFKLSGVKYYKTFRPPGWKISTSGAKVLTKMGFLIAGNQEYYNKVCSDIDNVKWVSYNWDLTSECKVRGDVVAYGHTSDWTNNYMDKTRFKIIDKFLSSNSFKYVFLEDIS